MSSGTPCFYWCLPNCPCYIVYCKTEVSSVLLCCPASPKLTCVVEVIFLPKYRLVSPISPRNCSSEFHRNYPRCWELQGIVGLVISLLIQFCIWWLSKKKKPHYQSHYQCYTCHGVQQVLHIRSLWDGCREEHVGSQVCELNSEDLDCLLQVPEFCLEDFQVNRGSYSERKKNPKILCLVLNAFHETGSEPWIVPSKVQISSQSRLIAPNNWIYQTDLPLLLKQNSAASFHSLLPLRFDFLNVEWWWQGFLKNLLH